MSDRFDNPPPTSARGRAPSARELALRAELVQLRHELKMLLEELDRPRAPPLPLRSATVTAVVPKTQLMYQGEAREGESPRPYMEAARVSALAEAYVEVSARRTRR